MYEIVNHEHKNRASPWFVDELLVLKCNLLEKLLFGFECCFGHSSNYVLRKLGRWDYVVMELIFYELSTAVSSMSIKNTENLYFGPRKQFWVPRCWLYDIQNNCDAVLIRFPNCAYVCVCSERLDCAERLGANFWRLKLLQLCWLFSFWALDKFKNLLLQNRVLYLSLLFRPYDWLFHSSHDLKTLL